MTAVYREIDPHHWKRLGDSSVRLSRGLDQITIARPSALPRPPIAGEVVTDQQIRTRTYRVALLQFPHWPIADAVIVLGAGDDPTYLPGWRPE